MIYFDEKKHSYTNVKTNERYISATTLIGKFKKPFDTDKHSKRVADREGVSQEEINAALNSGLAPLPAKPPSGMPPGHGSASPPPGLPPGFPPNG